LQGILFVALLASEGLPTLANIRLPAGRTGDAGKSQTDVKPAEQGDAPKSDEVQKTAQV
jgi:hypothetical protein